MRLVKSVKSVSLIKLVKLVKWVKFTVVKLSICLSTYLSFYLSSFLSIYLSALRIPHGHTWNACNMQRLSNISCSLTAMPWDPPTRPGPANGTRSPPTGQRDNGTTGRPDDGTTGQRNSQYRAHPQKNIGVLGLAPCHAPKKCPSFLFKKWGPWLRVLAKIWSTEWASTIHMQREKKNTWKTA